MRVFQIAIKKRGGQGDQVNNFEFIGILQGRKFFCFFRFFIKNRAFLVEN